MSRPVCLGFDDERRPSQGGAGSQVGVGEIGPVRVCDWGERTSFAVEAAASRLEVLDEPVEHLSDGLEGPITLISACHVHPLENLARPLVAAGPTLEGDPRAIGGDLVVETERGSA